MNPTQSKAEPMKQHVKYVGPKDTYTLQFPIPFESKSAAEGDPIQCKRDTPRCPLPHAGCAVVQGRGGRVQDV